MSTTTPRTLRADLLTSPESEPLRALARNAEIATAGAVHFAYATAPAATTYYVFNGNGGPGSGERLTRAKAAEFLHGVIADPAAYTQRWEPWTGYDR